MRKGPARKLFPSRVAKGVSFCNRVEERKRIQRNIADIQHTLIISPRRYGKTSLALKAIHDSKLPYAYIQFFNAFRDEIVIKRFVSGLSQLLTQLIPKSKKAIHKFMELVTHAKMSVNITGVKLGVELTPLSKQPEDIIEGLLKDIDKVLKERGEEAVIFFDEFQDIVESDISDELQSIVRDFAQLTEHVTFIISGSHRHMLLKLFDDSNKPFFKLFDRIDLRRIHDTDYQSFIQKLAKNKWGKDLSNDLIHEIFNLTELHAYYINRPDFNTSSA